MKKKPKGYEACFAPKPKHQNWTTVAQKITDKNVRAWILTVFTSIEGSSEKSMPLHFSYSLIF